MVLSVSAVSAHLLERRAAAVGVDGVIVVVEEGSVCVGVV